MYKPRSKKDRRVLRGWIKWVPVLAIPFSVLFFHAWINVQILRADYVLRELNAASQMWAGRLDSTDIAETLHEDPEVLAERAALLEFVQPTPGQREVIYYDPASVAPHPEDTHFEMARHDTPALAMPASDESRSAQSTLEASGATFTELPAGAAPTALAATAPEPAPAAPSPTLEATPPAATASPVPEAALVTTPVVLPLAALPDSVTATAEADPSAPETEPVVLDLPPDTRGLIPLDEDMGSLDSL